VGEDGGARRQPNAATCAAVARRLARITGPAEETRLDPKQAILIQALFLTLIPRNKRDGVAARLSTPHGIMRSAGMPGLP